MPLDPFYSTRKWRMTRAQHLREHPWCAICAAIYLQVPGVEVDHVIAKEQCVDPFDHDNLRTLCRQHHGQKTVALDGAHRGKKPFRITGPDGWPIPYRED